MSGAARLALFLTELELELELSEQDVEDLGELGAEELRTLTRNLADDLKLAARSSVPARNRRVRARGEAIARRGGYGFTGDV